MLVVTYIFLFLILSIPFLLLVSIFLKTLKFCISTFKDFKNFSSAATQKQEISLDSPPKL